jgi:hypothetical protein
MGDVYEIGGACCEGGLRLVVRQTIRFFQARGIEERLPQPLGGIDPLASDISGAGRRNSRATRDRNHSGYFS